MATEKIIFDAAKSFLSGKGFSNADSLASFMVAQSKHETGGYTSHVFNANNNAFGYKRFAGSPYQSGNGALSPEGDSYARYDSVKNSALEVAAWINRRKSIFQSVKSLDAYSIALKNAGYYGDTQTNYLAGLRRWFVENPVKTGIGAGAILLLVAGGFILITATSE